MMNMMSLFSDRKVKGMDWDKNIITNGNKKKGKKGELKRP